MLQEYQSYFPLLFFHPSLNFFEQIYNVHVIILISEFHSYILMYATGSLLLQDYQNFLLNFPFIILGLPVRSTGSLCGIIQCTYLATYRPNSTFSCGCCIISTNSPKSKYPELSVSASFMILHTTSSGRSWSYCCELIIADNSQYDIRPSLSRSY